MVIPRSLSAFSLSNTQAYLKEPLPIYNEKNSICNKLASGGTEYILGKKYCAMTRSQMLSDMCALSLPDICMIASTNLSSFFLKLLNGSLVNPSTLVDEVTSGGGFARVNMANDHNVDMNLLLGHFDLR